ncbi:MAG: hypothetical protein EOP48_30560 [Sphingobacteriales bacterium]|nr:MAG: hypothetical protein EOP48_30560 [Sphingobacteriales bacterium]
MNFMVSLMSMMRFLLFILSIISLNAFARQQVPLPVNQWKSYELPSSIDSLIKYNHSKIWYLSKAKNNVLATTVQTEAYKPPFPIIAPKPVFDHFYSERNVAKVDDGYLVGFYGGEWGGCLYWYSSDGKENYKISGDMVEQYVKRGNTLYAIEGVAHMGISRGRIIRLTKVDGKWTANEFLKLSSAPAAITHDDKNNFIVITHHSLLQINKDAEVTVLIDKGFWIEYLYPTRATIEMIKDSYYIGLRGGVLRFNRVTKSQEWLMPY